MKKKLTYKMIDLFAGCGGLSLGLEQAGFTPWFVNEIVEQFANTYKFNHHLSDEHYYIGDIAELNKHIDDYRDMFADITLVCGGPPCQGFSMANRQRILDDPRNGLYKQYLIFLSHVRPKFFIMENVKGMVTNFLTTDAQFKYLICLFFTNGEMPLCSKSGRHQYLLYSLFHCPLPYLYLHNFFCLYSSYNSSNRSKASTLSLQKPPLCRFLS